MGELFGVEAKTIGFHLQNIYQEGELIQDRTTQKIGVVQQEGTRSVNREPMFYNLDAIISVGYRVSSIRCDVVKIASYLKNSTFFERGKENKKSYARLTEDLLSTTGGQRRQNLKNRILLI